MRPASSLRLTAVLLAGLAACSGQQGCTCAGYTPTLQGTFAGTRLDSAGAVRLSGGGFATLNSRQSQLLAMIAPGGTLDVPVSCSVQSVSILGSSIGLTVADQGDFLCTTEACGHLDGKCDARDLPQVVHVGISSLQLVPQAPDRVDAIIHATVQTGKLMVSTVSRSSALCLFSGGGPLKCSIDFDTARAAPPENELDVGIRLTVDARWDKLLSLEVAALDGTKTCGSSGALPAPRCMDPNDMIIAGEPGTTCTACQGANVAFVKQLMLDQIASALKTRLDDALSKANCAPCGPAGECPTSAVAAARCEADAGTPDGGASCIDTGTSKCVPAMLGTEGVLDTGAMLAAAGAPPESALALALAAGGGAAADITGATVGLRGGFKAVTVPLCVQARTHATLPTLPLPDFEADAPGPYDVAFSLSQQYLSEGLFHAQQSGALCLQPGHDTVAQLDSSALATVLPSLGKLTGGQAVPLRVVVRPMNPPSATLGEGTFDVKGKPLAPLLRIDWKGVEVDVYALLDDRYARLFTVSADLALPMGLSLDGCASLTPVIGALAQAVTNVNVINSELLAEKPDVLQALVPTLLATAESSLAAGLPSITVPEVQGFQVELVSARGVGNISGTASYNHLGLYASLRPPTPVCVPMHKPAPPMRLRGWKRSGAEVAVPADTEVSWRLDGGFWSMWQRVESDGLLTVRHPALLLDATHHLELRTREGGLRAFTLERPVAPPRE